MLQQLAPGPLRVDPRRELLELIDLERPTAGQPKRRVAATSQTSAMAGEHMRGDSEQPRTRRPATRIKAAERAGRLKHRLRGQVRNVLRL
jgi:hypothetical protein